VNENVEEDAAAIVEIQAVRRTDRLADGQLAVSTVT
jgi:hypothetical protein